MPSAASTRQPAAWFSTPAGRAVLDSEDAAVRLAAQERPGQAGVWVRPVPHGPDRHAGPGLRLHVAAHGLDGDVRAGWCLPLASESCGVVVLQHVVDLGLDPAMLLEEGARVLVPGGRLWLLALNPLSPYRLRWQRQGPGACEPVTWRRRLRAAGLAPDAVSRGLGPAWSMVTDPEGQDGAGLRAAFLLRAEKRRIPLTPQRARARLHWQARPAA
jgi:SAM-dependent methyltransferase